MDYAQLKTGQQLPVHRYMLDAETVASYLQAVNDGSPLYAGTAAGGLVPPMAVAALSLRGVIEDLAIPGGTIHAGQELEFTGSLCVGQELVCRSTISQNSVRGQWRFLSIEMAVEDSNGRAVMRGRGTIMVPA